MVECIRLLIERLGVQVPPLELSETQNKIGVSQFESICMIMDSNIDFKYTIYKTTNKINGKVYIGCHKTLDPNDDYIGSGKVLRRAVKKYGRQSFEKEVLFIFDSSEEMFKKEAEIVDRLFVESDTSYNILVGGWGGFEHINSTGKNLYGKNGDEDHGSKNLWKWKKTIKYLKEKGLWEDYWKKVSESLKRRYKEKGFHWTGRKHKESTKKKIGEKLSVAQKGERNSQYGTCWVYSEKEGNKKIHKQELGVYLSNGWKHERKQL